MTTYAQPVAWITGSSRGIGAQIAERLAQDGMTVVLHANQNPELAQTHAQSLRAQGYTADVVQGDLSDPVQASAIADTIYKRYGRLDVLVNNAGIALNRLLCDCTDDDLIRILHTNLLSAMVCSREAAKRMMFARHGNIVNISSMWGQVGASGEVAYSATKAGLIGLTRALAKELGDCGIRVNCICPGVIDTDMNRNLQPQDLQELVDATPCGRLGTPADIAEAVAFLVSDRASFIHGQVIGVNGGFVI